MNPYLDRAGLSCDSPLFCQLSKTKCGYKPRSKGLSYSRLRELVLGAFKDIFLDISAIGTHSLRSRGTTAAANAGVPDRLFKRHGRWASESAQDGYVQDSLPVLDYEQSLWFLIVRRERSKKNRPRESWPRESWCLGERRKKGTTDKASAIDLCVACTTQKCDWLMLGALTDQN